MTVLNKRPPCLPRGRTLSGVCLQLLLVSSAWALDPCDDQLSKLPPELTVTQRLRELAASEPRCAKSGHFLYQFGRLLNLAGRYDEALDRLEGAVLHQPDHWPSQLEFAIALEGVGDAQSAAGVLDNLAHNTQVDDATRQQIAALRQAKPYNITAPQIDLVLATGYDDNLLGDTRHETIELTLPGGQVPLVVDEQQRPHAAPFLRTELRLHDDLYTTASGTRWRYALFASHRHSPAYPPARLDNLGAYVEYVPAQTPGVYALAGQQAFARAGNSVLRQSQWVMGLDTRLGTASVCQQRIALDLQYLDYPASPKLNGSYRGLLGQVDCTAAAVQLTVRWGQDQPRWPGRPGGEQHLYSVRLSKKLPMPPAVLTLEGEYNLAQDQNGYSPLLANNATRRIRRNSYRLQARWPYATWNPFITVEWVDQRSNLALFDVNNRVLTVGLQRKW